MALTLEALETLIDTKVLSGGRRTKGVSMRQVLKEIAYYAQSIDDDDIGASDIAYGTGWNGVTTVPPSKNAVYDMSLLLLPLDGSRTMTGDILFANNKGIKWGVANQLYITSDGTDVTLYNEIGGFAYVAGSHYFVGNVEVDSSYRLAVRYIDSPGGSGDININTDALSGSTATNIGSSVHALSIEVRNDVVATFKGRDLRYFADYVASYADRSIPDWGNVKTYADGKLALVGGTMSGNVLFTGGAGVDTTATGGSDVLNIGTTNANVINIGNSSTVLNFLGTAIFEYQANQYVTDKLITLNYGGSLASGIGAGFEIEENSVITGYLKTNGTRTGFSFKSPANAGVIDIITIGTDVVLTAGTTGTIAVTQNKLSVFAATTSAELLSVISDETGSGALVFANTPTLVTPVLGVATATSINGNAITAGSGTLTLSGFTLTVPATGTAALLGTANVFTADQSHTANIIPTATNTYDFGANTSTGDWRKAYIRTITVADASGTNTTGTSLSLLAGAGTGTGTETYLAFQTAIKGTSGSTVQSLANTMTIGLLSGSSTFATIWMNTVPASRTNSNYVLSSDAAGTFLNGSTSVNLSIAGSTKVGVTSTNINLISTNIVSGGSTSSVFRLTNGGSDVTAHFCIDPQGSVSTAGGLAYTFDATNGMSFTHANGTRRIRGWSAKLTTLVNTSGSESSDITWTPQNATDNFIIAGNLNLSDTNFVLGTTTGTKIGTATSQKLAFWNATPIVQITTSVTAATFVANTSLTANDSATWDGYTIGQIVKALRNLGLLA